MKHFNLDNSTVVPRPLTSGGFHPRSAISSLSHLDKLLHFSVSSSEDECACCLSPRVLTEDNSACCTWCLGILNENFPSRVWLMVLSNILHCIFYLFSCVTNSLLHSAVHISCLENSVPFSYLGSTCLQSLFLEAFSNKSSPS